MDLAQLTDASLHSELKRLAGSSNTLSAQLLVHLGEVEARGIHRERACSSLYMYCVYELRMSEDEAQRRCRAARLAREFPILLEMLAEGSLHLTGILLIGPHLTRENCAELLARARFRTKREIERLVAEMAPGHEVPSRIVPLCRAGAVDNAVDGAVSPLSDEKAGLLAWPRNTWAAYVQGLAGAVRDLPAGLGAGQAPPRASEGPIVPATAFGEEQESQRHETGHQKRNPAPVGEPRYKVQFTADQAYVDLLEEARNLLQHELPSRDLAAVQRRALELLVHRLRQRKHAASERPRPKASKPASGTQSSDHGRHIPADVRRDVWQRDEARCAYVDARGQRCREQAGLEFHHQQPHATRWPTERRQSRAALPLPQWPGSRAGLRSRLHPKEAGRQGGAGEDDPRRRGAGGAVSD